MAVGIAIMCVVFIALSTSAGLRLAIFGAWMVANALRIVFVLVLMTMATSNVYVYKSLGWTPMSLIFGDEIYASSLKYLKQKEAKKQPAPRNHTSRSTH